MSFTEACAESNATNCWLEPFSGEGDPGDVGAQARPEGHLDVAVDG